MQEWRAAADGEGTLRHNARQKSCTQKPFESFKRRVSSHVAEQRDSKERISANEEERRPSQPGERPISASHIWTYPGLSTRRLFLLEGSLAQRASARV